MNTLPSDNPNTPSHWSPETAHAVSLLEKRLNKDDHIQLSQIVGNLRSAGTDHIASVYITSIAPDEGKTLCSILLGEEISRVHRILLIDGNTDNPLLSCHYRKDHLPGLIDAVCSETPVDTAMKLIQPIHTRLAVLPIGKPDWTGTDRCLQLELYVRRLALLLESLQEEYDHVVIDGHAMKNSSEPELYANIADKMAMVVACEQTKEGPLRWAIEHLEDSGGTVAGVILNKRKSYVPNWLYSKI
jgi:Mrp family chromosome partitioning ATPase